MILNAKDLMQKTTGNVFLGHQGGWVFHIFPKLHSIIKLGCPLIHLRIFVDHVTLFNLSPMQHLRWSSLWQKKNSWLETVVDCCYREVCIECDKAPRSDSEMY